MIQDWLWNCNASIQNYSYKHVSFSFCLIFNEMTNILFNRIHFSKTTSFRQSIWHGFIWCMGKCFPCHNTHFWWCMWNVMIYNFGCLYCQILTYLSLVIDFCQLLLILCDRCCCWQKSITNDKYVKIWQYKHPKLYIITFHIHHQKWVLWQGKHFPIHWMKPCQMDWQKLVVLEKMYSVKENISHFIENYSCYGTKIPHWTAYRKQNLQARTMLCKQK